MARDDYLPPDLDAKASSARRRQKLAETMLAQSLQPRQGRMAGRIYVAPSPLEGIAQVAQAWAANRAGERADTEIGDIAKEGLQRTTDELARIMAMHQGSPGTPTPLGEDPNGGTVDPMPTGAVRPDPEGAAMAALFSENPRVSDVGKALLASSARKAEGAENRAARLQERAMTLEAQEQNAALSAEARRDAAKMAADARRENAELMARTQTTIAGMNNKPSESERRIADLVTSGMTPDDARGVAYGTRRVIADPVTGAPRMVDIRTGAEIPVKAEAGAAQPEAAAKSPTDTDTLWSMAEETAGAVPAARDVWGRVAGQISGNLVPENTSRLRQKATAAMNDMIRALSINPKFPVAEINRIKDEMDIGPAILDSPAALRQRLQAVDEYLRGRLVAAEADAQDSTLPKETQRGAAASAAEIRNFLPRLGVPSGGQAPAAPTGGQTPMFSDPEKQRRYEEYKRRQGLQ